MKKKEWKQVAPKRTLDLNTAQSTVFFSFSTYTTPPIKKRRPLFATIFQPLKNSKEDPDWYELDRTLHDEVHDRMQSKNGSREDREDDQKGEEEEEERRAQWSSSVVLLPIYTI